MTADDLAPVALIGPMAAGKSAVGRSLARLLARDFVDTDREIARRHGPIPDIFAARGEPGFRQLEADAVAEALRPGAVVALGGGAVLHPETRQRLAAAAVVLVTVTPEAVALRIANDRRPLLAAGGLDAWLRILSEREPLYRELADVEADNSTRPPRTVAEELAAWVLEHEASGGAITEENGTTRV